MNDSQPFAASPFQDTDDLSKENLLSSLLLFDSMTLMSGKNHDETSETLKTAPCENEASKQEKEVVMSGLTSKSKEEISGQGKQEHVREFALLEPTASPPSKSQLLRYLCNNILSAFSVKQVLFLY